MDQNTNVSDDDNEVVVLHICFIDTTSILFYNQEDTTNLSCSYDDKYMLLY